MKLHRARQRTLVPMNAMSDVAFLLLIFIMLLALINYRREVKIEYPEAENAGRVGSARNLEIQIDRAGGLYLDGAPSGVEDIERVLGDVYRAAPGTRVHVIADKNTPYRNVAAVLELLQLLEYRAVSFVVRHEQ